MTGVIELLGFGFVRRALVAGVLIAIGCGGMGVFLVLRRYAMIGDGLSHVAFGTVGLALLLGWAPLYTALPLVALASLAIMELPERTAMYGDAAIAMVSAAGIALGVLLASLGGGFNVDLFGFLFGDILAIHVAEVWLSGALVLVIGIAVALQYYALLAVTFDESAAVVLGLRPRSLNRLLAVLTALLVVLGIRMVGTMLVSSLLVFPAVTALQWRQGFRAVLLTAAAIGGASVVLGILVALWLDFPAGASIVLIQTAVFGLTAFAGILRERAVKT